MTLQAKLDAFVHDNFVVMRHEVQDLNALSKKVASKKKRGDTEAISMEDLLESQCKQFVEHEKGKMMFFCFKIEFDFVLRCLGKVRCSSQKRCCRMDKKIC